MRKTEQISNDTPIENHLGDIDQTWRRTKREIEEERPDSFSLASLDHFRFRRISKGCCCYSREKNEEEESVKLFVGQIPKHMSESQLLTLFQEFAVVDEVNIIKDKITRASRGFLFFFFNLLHASVFDFFFYKVFDWRMWCLIRVICWDLFEFPKP